MIGLTGVGLRSRAPDFAPSSKLRKAMSDKPGGYVGQDFGELSRVAVVEFWLVEWWGSGVAEWCDA
jgi:hypothetical protein